ncbi:beta-galactosidase [Ruania zhangjianzhongii]|uniref:beta-galactosidase n=1 Tax=Ruania zhangjianzhongii TaxID=2603206 RepID=UPI0011C765A4|nr:beta-galactosidase [Ruania zhangjianzhongii]
MADDVTDPSADTAAPLAPAEQASTESAPAAESTGTDAASAEAPEDQKNEQADTASAEAPEADAVTEGSSTASAEAGEGSATSATDDASAEASEAEAEPAAEGEGIAEAEVESAAEETGAEPEPAPTPAKPATPDWPIGLTALGYGGDYNPEQWPMHVRLEDVELMREAGINLVSLAIFAWASIEPREGRYEWAWLDNIMDRLSAAGVKVALATATASPPPWLTMKNPEILPRTAEGVVLNQGGRQAYAPSSTVYRDYAVKMAKAMAERYGEHPALALWHIDNEIGCHTPHDFSESATRAFRTWLRRKYRTIDRLNDAWGTAFWSQRYGAFKDVLPPLVAPTYANPSQQLDFARFSSDTMLEYYRKLRDAVRPITPKVPSTTNFMVSLNTKWMDYFRWAEEVDVVATDHYTIAADPEREIDLALAADMTRGVAQGKRWILMEHSSGAVNWQPHNRAKGPGEMLRNSLSHVARGADSVMFFQIRASKAGAEKFHSALIPHAGRDSAIWRESVRLGEVLGSLSPVLGSTVRAKAALIFDYQAWWATELDSHPSEDVSYADRIRALYRELWYRGVPVDVVQPSADLSGYDLVLVPTLYLVKDADAENIAAAAEAGATVAITYFSGIVDENDQVRLGGYPGAFRELLGVRSDEFFPLLDGEAVTLDDGSSADVWTERIELTSAEARRSFTDGPLPGGPAITRNQVGEGAAWYVATRQDEAGTGALLDALLAESGVQPVAQVPRGVEAMRRVAEDGTEFLFLLNHTDTQAQVPANGTDLVTGVAVTDTLTLAAGDVAVVQEDPAAQ